MKLNIRSLNVSLLASLPLFLQLRRDSTPLGGELQFRNSVSFTFTLQIDVREPRHCLMKVGAQRTFCTSLFLRVTSRSFKMPKIRYVYHYYDGNLGFSKRIS